MWQGPEKRRCKVLKKNELILKTVIEGPRFGALLVLICPIAHTKLLSAWYSFTVPRCRPDA